jgi:aspartate aminotransferase
MTLRPSTRANAIPESITLAIAARASALIADGQDVISLGAGEPDFGTVDHVAQAGIRAIEAQDTRYTSASGKPALRKAAAAWFERHFGLDYAPEEVMVTAGAKPALTMALTAVLEPGDKVLLTCPYWPSYTAIVEMCGGVPVEIPAVPDQGFVHTGAQIAQAAKEHGARGVMLNYPNNPTGCVPTRAQVEDLVAACVEHDLWILSDEIYARLIYDGAEHVSPASFPQARARTMVVNGGTKSHSMTGWRVGFLAGPADMIAAAGRLQSQAIGNPCTISQAAALALCNEADDGELKRRLAAFDERRRFVVSRIAEIDGLALDEPRGAFYAMVDARAACERLAMDDVQLTEALLTEALVSVVPGSAFAAPGFLRLSYAASMADLEKAMDRIAAFLGSGGR